MTVVAQVVFPHQANGSLIERDGKVVGSELIGQPFDDPQVLLEPAVGDGAAPTTAALRPAATGPTNPAQLDAVRRPRRSACRKRIPIRPGPVPVDLVTASGSGLDPHISPAAAEYQVARVAKARGMTPRRRARAGR